MTITSVGQQIHNHRAGAWLEFHDPPNAAELRRQARLELDQVELSEVAAQQASARSRVANRFFLGSAAVMLAGAGLSSVSPSLGIGMFVAGLGSGIVSGVTSLVNSFHADEHMLASDHHLARAREFEMAALLAEQIGSPGALNKP